MKARTAALMLLALAGLPLLAACAGGSNTRPTETATDPATTMAVPDDDNMLARRLRQSLAERGWTLTSYDVAALQGNRDYAYMARRAHYRMTLSATRIGGCRNGDPSFLYNLAIIENRTGDVAIALTGANCMDTAVERFESNLDRRQILPAANGGAGG